MGSYLKKCDKCENLKHTRTWWDEEYNEDNLFLCDKCNDVEQIKKDKENCEIAKARLANFEKKPIIKENDQLELFAQAV